MKWLIAIVLPPLALLLCGKPFQAVLNLGLCLFGYLPGIVHALLVVNEDRRRSSEGVTVRIE